MNRVNAVVIGAGAAGYFDFDTYDDVGPGASIAVSDYNHGTPGLTGVD
jgi:hypothetical protein